MCTRPAVRLVALAYLALAAACPPSGSGAADAPKAADPPEAPKLEPAEVVRGSQVPVSGANLPPDPQKIIVLLGNGNAIHPTHADRDGKWFKFVVPAGPRWAGTP